MVNVLIKKGMSTVILLYLYIHIPLITHQDATPKIQFKMFQ